MWKKSYDDGDIIVDIKQVEDIQNPKEMVPSTIVYNNEEVEIYGDIAVNSLYEVMDYIYTDLDIPYIINKDSINLEEFLLCVREYACVLGIVRLNRVNRIGILCEEGKLDVANCVGFIYIPYEAIVKPCDMPYFNVAHTDIFKKFMIAEIHSLSSLLTEEIFSIDIKEIETGEYIVKNALFYGTDIFNSGIYSFISNYSETISSLLIDESLMSR